MCGNERRPARAGGDQRGLETVPEGDKRVEADGQGVRAPSRIVVMVGQLEAREDEQVVERRGASRLGGDRRDVLGVALCGDVHLPVAQRVICDAEDVEPTVAVEVDKLAKRQAAVAPRRVRVELAEQWCDALTHRLKLAAQRRTRVSGRCNPVVEVEIRRRRAQLAVGLDVRAARRA